MVTSSYPERCPENVIIHYRARLI